VRGSNLEVHTRGLPVHFMALLRGARYDDVPNDPTASPHRRRLSRWRDRRWHKLLDNQAPPEGGVFALPEIIRFGLACAAINLPLSNATYKELADPFESWSGVPIPQARQGQRRVGSRGHRQVQVAWQMVEQKRDGISLSSVVFPEPAGAETRASLPWSPAFRRWIRRRRATTRAVPVLPGGPGSPIEGAGRGGEMMTLAGSRGVSQDLGRPGRELPPDLRRCASRNLDARSVAW